MRVKQISNLFELMAFFVRAKKPLSVKEVVDEFSWPRSSVFNIVSTMVEEGYLYQPVPRGGYYPSSKWMELAKDLLEFQPFPPAVHKLLVELVKLTGETVVLAAAEGSSVVFLDVVESPAVIRFTASNGQRNPIHVTAAGRAILSQYSPSERAAVLKRIDYEPYEKAAFMSAVAVEEDIQKSMKDGWYINLGSYAEGLAGVAVPFPFHHRRCSIVIGAPISRIENSVEELGALLRSKVNDFLEADLGLDY